MADASLVLRDTAPDDIVDAVTAICPDALLVDPALVNAAARGWSSNTIRAFLSDLRIWDHVCRLRAVAASEARAEDVAAFIRALAGTDHVAGIEPRAAATIARYLVNIGWAYRMAALVDPTDAPIVRLEMKAARRALGTRQRQARAIRYKGDIEDLDAPASGVCLSHLLAACRRDLLGDRDRALLMTAYDSGCRRSELVAIRVEDVEGPDSIGAGSVVIGQSKTDQEGAGEVAYLSPATMRAIARWRETGHIDTGPLFRRVETHFDGSVRTVGRNALHPNSVTLIYRRLVQAAFDKQLFGAMSHSECARWIEAISSHSIRVGVAQDNFAAGESLPAIMQAYRWRDPRTVLRYGAKLAAKSGASARLAKRFAASP